MKKCTKCGLKKSSAKFSKDKSRNDGLQCYCKSCCLEYQRSPAGKKSGKKYRSKPAVKATIREYQKIYDQTPVRKEVDRRRSERLRKTLHKYLYSRWTNMVQRCTNPEHIAYQRYGGRGIRCLFTKDGFYNYVVNELGFETVASLKGKDVHRIDGGNSNYERGNIEFITKKEHGLRHRELNQKYNRSVA